MDVAFLDPLEVRCAASSAYVSVSSSVQQWEHSMYCCEMAFPRRSRSSHSLYHWTFASRAFLPFWLGLCLCAPPQRLLRGCWAAVGFGTWQSGQPASHSSAAHALHSRALLLPAALCGCCVTLPWCRGPSMRWGRPHRAAGTLQLCPAVPEERPFCEVGQASFTASVTSHNDPHLFSCVGTFNPAVGSLGIL